MFGTRDGRSILYATDYDGALLLYLMVDCCQGRTELCAPVADLSARLAKRLPTATARSLTTAALRPQAAP